MTRFRPELRDSLLDIHKSHRLRIHQHRHDRTIGRSNRNAKIDIISIDDQVAFDARVRRGDPLEREYEQTRT